MSTAKSRIASCHETETRFVRVGGQTVRVCVRHRGNAHLPLVICNGIGQSCETIAPLADCIPNRTIITFDAVGVGRSSVSHRPISMKQHAEILAETLDQLDIPLVDLMGLSWGGALAQQFAFAYAGRCRRLVLAITSAGGSVTFFSNPFSTLEVFLPFRHLSKSWSKLIGPVLYGGETLRNSSELREYASRNVTPSLAGYYNQIAAVCSWSSLPWLHKLRQRTLVLSADYDPLIPAWNHRLLAARIPFAELKSYPEGHLLTYSHRHTIGPEIAHFLDRD